MNEIIKIKIEIRYQLFHMFQIIYSALTFERIFRYD